MSRVTADSDKPSGTCYMWSQPKAGTSLALCRFCVESSLANNRKIPLSTSTARNGPPNEPLAPLTTAVMLAHQ